MQIDASTAAIVTGAASGLGEATARRLAGQGARVSILDVNAERGQAVAAAIGGLFIATDVTDEASVEAALASAAKAHGAARIIVNCAGIAPARRTVTRKRDSGAFIAHDLATFTRTIAINLIGTFLMISKGAAAMAGLDPVSDDGLRGVIVNTASVAAEDGQIGQAAYAASKGGIVSLTLPMARDLAPFGIRVVTIMPGLFETPMYASVPDDLRKALEASVPFPARLGRASEYADFVAAIVDNDMLNGASLRLDGAIRLPPK